MVTSTTVVATVTTTDEENPFRFCFEAGRVSLLLDGDEVFELDTHPLSQVLDHLEHAVKRARIALVKHRKFEEGVKLMEQEFERSEGTLTAAAGTGISGLALGLLGSGRAATPP